MAQDTRPLHFALRERRRGILLGALWLLITLLCAVAGPFGTHEALALPQRFIYWGTVVAVSVLASLIPDRLARFGRGAVVLGWGLYVLLISALVLTLNRMVFGGWDGLRDYLNLAITVAVVVGVINALLWLVRFARPEVQPPETSPEARFLRRLPLATRAPLVRIEAQDHYINVVTTKGSAMILMRLGEAVEELQGAEGLLVHRSHWVAFSGVRAHRRDKGRDILQMSDGAEVPVSRSNKAAAQAAGLF